MSIATDDLRPLDEAFLRAWRRRETYEGRASVRAWLYRIATNARYVECFDLPATLNATVGTR